MIGISDMLSRALFVVLVVSVLGAFAQYQNVPDYCGNACGRNNPCRIPYQPTCGELTSLHHLWNSLKGKNWISSVGNSQGQRSREWFDCRWLDDDDACDGGYDAFRSQSRGPCGQWSDDSDAIKPFHGIICANPTSIQDHSNVRYVEILLLSANNLDGELPDHLGGLVRLRQLYLFKNKIRGSLPNSLFDMTRLTHLYLFDNEITGFNTANNWGKLTRLQKLYLDNNLATGTASFISSLPALTHFNATNNRLTGTIPNIRTTNPNLISLYLSHNQLSGSVPVDAIRAPNLRFFVANDNLLSGPIADVGDISTSHLISLNLANNNLTCRLPPFMESVPYPIDVRNNRVNGAPGFFCPVSGLPANVLRDLDCSDIRQHKGETILIDAMNPQRIGAPSRPTQITIRGENFLTDCPLECSLTGFPNPIPALSQTPTEIVCDLSEVDFLQFTAGFQRLCVGQDGRGITGNCTLLNVYFDCGMSPEDHTQPYCGEFGICDTSAGTCRCIPPYYGDRCQFRNCPECNTGTCDPDTGTCQCPPGTGGLNCVPSEACSLPCVEGRGQCSSATLSCVCYAQYEGEFCQYYKCPDCHIPGSIGQEEDGQTYYCDRQTGTCRCKPGWVGPRCSIQQQSCGDCGEDDGWGYCNAATGQCVCIYPRTGVDCSEQLCPPCVRGTCNSQTGECECDQGWFGNTCNQNNLCNGVDCGENGVCSVVQNPDRAVCVCTGGFTGENCDEIPCIGNCNGFEGACNTTTGQCDCPEGWRGDACTVRFMPCDPIDCHGNGYCDTNTGQCVCDNVNPPYINGTSCGERSCFGTPECSGHGVCNRQTGECECAEPYYGLTCAFMECPDGCGDVLVEDCTLEEQAVEACSNKTTGMCDITTGICVCQPEFWGDSCQFKRCPNDCGTSAGWGECDGSTGSCLCGDRYEGDDCSIEKPDIVGIIVAVALALVITIVLIVAGFFIWRHFKIQEIKKRMNAQQQELDNLDDDQDENSSDEEQDDQDEDFSE